MLRSSRAAFTLIELLVVIAIIAILSVVVILALNPAQLLMQARDTNRISDMASLYSAISIYTSQGGISLGSSSVVYVSIPDPLATSTAGDQCQGLGLPALPASDTYQCAASSNFRNVNGTGWIPVNLTTLAGGSPIGQLPIDPLNQSSSNFYYTYATNGSQFVVTATPESQKYRMQYTLNPAIGSYSGVIAQGTSLTVSPLYNPTGLVGYWPFEEGSGTSTADKSGNGNTGLWNGTPTGSSGTYYAVGKVGNYAGNFDGSTDYVNLGNNSILQPTTAITAMAWIKIAAYPTQVSVIMTVAQSNAPWSFDLWNDNGGLTGLNVFMTNAGGNYTALSLPAPPVNQWVHVAFTWGAGALTIYENGVPETYSASGFIASGTSAIYIGWDGVWSKFNGQIDDAREYNRVLSAAEIQAIYDAGK